ncbi:MAG: hypothetical protein CVU23_14815, partial [Betaproteobacteria bacterium HGW-Betaproteobacteria-17]
MKSTAGLAFLTVIAPTFIALAYFGLLAQDVYISESRIVVRQPTEGPRSPLNLALDQTGFGAANEGNNTVVAYLQSRAAIAAADTDGKIKA